MLKVVHETIRRDRDQSLTCIDQDMVAFACPYHRHPEFEVVRIDESAGRILVGDWSGRFGPGEVYVLGGYLPHAFLNDAGTLRARSRCLQFLPDWMESLAGIWPELRPLRQLQTKARRGWRLTGEAAKRVSPVLDRVCTSRGSAQIVELIRLMHTLLVIDAPPGLASDRYDVSRPDPGIPRLEPVLRHIHEHATETISVHDLARMAGLSVSAFHRFFRQRMGLAPGAYVLDVRFSAIAQRLLLYDDSIAEIAFACGFNNLSNFNRLFRRRFGSSPRAYRQRVQAESTSPQRSAPSCRRERSADPAA